MALRLFIATTNPGKLADFREAAEEYEIVLDPVPGLRTIPAPQEDGDTFEANAITKAVYYSGFAPGEVVIADDSGLEVDALNGAPGVRSARYADDMGCPAPPATSLDERNNLCLLRELDCLPDTLRAARYRCVLAAARNGEILQTAHGTVEGTILTAPRGTSGFGYDPLFYIPEQALTMAEIDPITRLSLSHRGRALRALLDHLIPQLQPH
jgi:XTP/dITP diphosphohydrolase